MVTPLGVRVEIRKLAAVLHVDEGDLAPLAALPADDVRQFRGQVLDRLFDEHGDSLARVAKATGILPGSVSATIARKHLGPMLCARIATRLDARKAIDLAGRLDPAFLAELAAELDPRRAADIVAGLKADTIVAVAAELEARADFVTLGRFVGFVSPEALTQIVAGLDDRTVLRCAGFVEPAETVGVLLGELGDERVRRLVVAAVDDELVAELLTPVGFLSCEQMSHIVTAIADLDDAVLDQLMDAIGNADLWHGLEPVTAAMDPSTRSSLRDRATATGAIRRHRRLGELLR